MPAPEVYPALVERKQAVMDALLNELNNGTPYKDLPLDMQAYLDYISIDLMQSQTGLLMMDVVDTSDATYKAWTNEEVIRLKQYLNYTGATGT